MAHRHRRADAGRLGRLTLQKPGRRKTRGTGRAGRVLALGLAVLLCACDEGAGEPDTAGAPAQRIVTLAPHLTELVYAAGAGAKLVGAVEYSDFPPQARALPRVGDSFRMDFERIAALKPDLVLAWESGNPVRAIERLEALDLHVVVIGTYRLADIATALRTIGRLAGRTATAERAAAGFEREIAALVARYADAPEISVFYQISLKPLFTVNGGHMISELLEVCGGRNIFADLTELAPAVSIEAVLARNPEVILAPGEGGARALEFWRAWPELAAVRRENLFTVDADLVARATTRTLAGARDICRKLDAARAADAETARSFGDGADAGSGSRGAVSDGVLAGRAAAFP